MRTFTYRISITIMSIICVLLVLSIISGQRLPEWDSVARISTLHHFNLVLIDIILEAFPFILLGVFVSALLQTYVSEQTVRRFVPRHPLLGILYACVLGVAFPICECGMIPVMRKLLHKGLPLYIAVTFMVSGPVLNPVVFISTWTAFPGMHSIVWYRMGLAFVCAAAIGLIVYRFVRANPLRSKQSKSVHHHDHVHSHDHDHHSHHTHQGHHHHHHHDHDHKGSNRGNKWPMIWAHAREELFEMGKYLLLGATLTAVIQSALSRDVLVGVGGGAWSSHLFMISFAYLLSLCSTSDAFVASSFVSTFTTGSLLSFLVLGPMFDFKGTIMLSSIFKTRFVAKLGFIIVAVVLASSLALERLTAVLS